MRRRRALNIWPAFADLMTVLAVPGLFTALGLFPYFARNDDLLASIRSLQQIVHDLENQIAAQKEEIDSAQKAWNEEKAGLTIQLREAARNEDMFRAIQRAQDFIDEIATDPQLAFGPDQSLSFGDDLVSFELNGYEPIWRPGGVEKLRSFCRSLSRSLKAASDRSAWNQDLLIVEIGGHTDSTQCPGDPHCNWWISSARAAAFLATMKEGEYCPGARQLNLRPVGYADTRPEGIRGAQPESSRRIAVRLELDYGALLGSLERSRDGLNP